MNRPLVGRCCRAACLQLNTPVHARKALRQQRPTGSRFKGLNAHPFLEAEPRTGAPVCDRLSRNDAVQPRMNTDGHGCRLRERPPGQTRLGTLIGERVFPFRRPFLIRVYPCPSVVKHFSYAWIRLRAFESHKAGDKSVLRFGEKFHEPPRLTICSPEPRVVGRITPCAPRFGTSDDGAHGVARPTLGLMPLDAPLSL